MNPAAAPFLSLQGLRKRFGRREVLRGISLEIARGEVVALIGPSGSGKSTLLRCINLLTLPDAGQMVLDGQRLDFGPGRAGLPDDRSQARLRTQVGMVFQHFNLFPHRNVLENVMEGPRVVLRLPPEQARERALALLERVGLQDQAGQAPDHLSGGQKQRVAIARALAMQPRMMLFDEATSALDPELVGEVLTVMRALADDGMTMLLVTHEIAFAREVADRVVFMREGEIVESGPAAQVIEHPLQAATQAFLERFHRRA